MSTGVVPMRWGVDPLPEQLRIAELLREVTSLVLAQENAGPELADLIRSLEVSRTLLHRSAPDELVARVGDHAHGPGRVYLDHCRDIHAWNPVFPAYTMSVESAARAVGTVNFPICFEGPAGGVNGGVLGVFFDAVVQHHNCELGVSGATRDLAITYRRKTPLLVDLDFEIARTVDDRSVRSEVSILREGTVLCTATTSAATFEARHSPIVDPRRES